MVKNYNLNEIIFSVVNQNCDLLLKNEEVLSGHNGPYFDKETNVRCISHWILLYEYCYNISLDKKYKNCIQILANQLYNSPYKNKNFTYISRNSSKDNINGVIGAAWIIEGLIAAAKCLKDDKYYNLAVEVFKSQKFDEKRHLWTRIDENNNDIGFDLTFNHELWFAAAGSIIVNYKFDGEIDYQVRSFLKVVNKRYKTLPDGVIYHFINVFANFKQYIMFWKKYYYDIFNDIFHKKSLRYKEEGYHFFTMYAFSILYNNYSNEKVFKTKKFKKALFKCFDKNLIIKLSSFDYSSLDSTEIKKEIVDKKVNIYGFPYNAPGFEIPYIYKTFRPRLNPTSIEICHIAIENQISLTYSKDSKIFSNNTPDWITLTARLYELTRGVDYNEIEN